MEETERYLNSILEKRLGSVINQSSFSKNGNTVTRLPRQQEKIESMPTFFREKHETILKNRSQMQSEYDSRSSFLSQNEQLSKLQPQEQAPTGTHRVEYMAISKRIKEKEGTDFISPTIDVTKYRSSQMNVARSISPVPIRISSIKEQQQQQREELPREDSGKDGKPKRRRIFG